MLFQFLRRSDVGIILNQLDADYPNNNCILGIYMYAHVYVYVCVCECACVCVVCKLGICGQCLPASLRVCFSGPLACCVFAFAVRILCMCCVYKNIYIHICIHIYEYIYVCVNTCIHIHVYIYIRVHICCVCNMHVLCKRESTCSPINYRYRVAKIHRMP